MSEKRTLARPYAKAIFEMALQSKNFEAWSSMLTVLCMIIEDERVQRLLNNPTINPEILSEFFMMVASGALDEAGKNLLNTLAQKKRLKLLPDIKILYETFREEAEKILPVTCITAVPLSETQKKGFIEVLTKRFGRTIELSCEVNPELVGGFFIKAGDTIIDGSVRGQLQQLKDIMGE